MCFGAEPEHQGAASARHGRRRRGREAQAESASRFHDRPVKKAPAEERAPSARHGNETPAERVAFWGCPGRKRSATPPEKRLPERFRTWRGEESFLREVPQFFWGTAKTVLPRLQAGPAFVPAFCLNEKPRPGRGGKHAGRTQAISYPRGQEPARYPVLNEIRLHPFAHCGAHTWERYTGGRLSAAIHVRHAQPLLYSL